MRVLLRSMAIVALALSLGGCGTVANLFAKNRNGGQGIIYGGIQEDAHSIGSGDALVVVICVIDFPLSLVMDTVTLPVTIIMTLNRPSVEPSSESNPSAPEPRKPQR